MENYIWKIQVRLHRVVPYTTANTRENVAFRERKRRKRKEAWRRKKKREKLIWG